MRHVGGVIDSVGLEAAVAHGEDPALGALDALVVSLVERNDKGWRCDFDVYLVIAEVSFQSRGIAVDLLRQLLEIHLLDCGAHCRRLQVLGFEEVGDD